MAAVEATASQPSEQQLRQEEELQQVRQHLLVCLPIGMHGGVVTAYHAQVNTSCGSKPHATPFFVPCRVHKSLSLKNP